MRAKSWHIKAAAPLGGCWGCSALPTPTPAAPAHPHLNPAANSSHRAPARAGSQHSTCCCHNQAPGPHAPNRAMPPRHRPWQVWCLHSVVLSAPRWADEAEDLITQRALSPALVTGTPSLICPANSTLLSKRSVGWEIFAAINISLKSATTSRMPPPFLPIGPG